jgi:Arc/MetJ-type ribon-helix-helix transcriptional regulator
MVNDIGGCMVRTIVSLDEEDKVWLDRKAAREGISMTELIRRAVKRLRSEEKEAQSFERLLRSTSGIGTGEDGLAAQRRLRDEWRRNPA